MKWGAGEIQKSINLPNKYLTDGLAPLTLETCFVKTERFY